MDTEIQKRVEDTADAELDALVSAYENDQLSEYFEEEDIADSGEVKCTLTGELQDYEYVLCGGGPTAILSYEYITVTWGSNIARRSVPKEVSDKIWDMTVEQFEMLFCARINKKKRKY